MFEFILKGGVVMYPILFCSVIALAIILERSYCLLKAWVGTKGLLRRVRELVAQKRLEEALSLCQAGKNPTAKVISCILRGHSEKAAIRIGSHQMRKLEKNLRGLAIIGNITPLLGLFGTVTGMIKAFMKIEELGSSVDASLLAGGIWEALMTTAAGLAVAIPALVAYHYLEGKIDDYGTMMKEISEELLERILGSD